MKLKTGLAALVAAMAGMAAAQDGGKILWQGKEKDADIQKVMEQAKEDGKAMMLFFTSEG